MLSIVPKILRKKLNEMEIVGKYLFRKINIVEPSECPAESPATTCYSGKEFLHKQ